MLAKLFNDITVGSLARALVFSLLAAVLAVVFFVPVDPFFEVAGTRIPVSPLFYRILFVAVIVVCTWWFNARVNAFGFLKNDYQLAPALSLLLLPPLAANASLELLLVFPLGMILVVRVLSLSVRSGYAHLLFDVGVLIGLMALLVPESLLFIVLAWVAVWSFGSASFRALLIPLIGIMAVWFMLFTLVFWLSDLEVVPAVEEIFSDFGPGFTAAWPENWWRYIPLLLVLLPAFAEMLQVYGKANVLKKQVFGFLLVFTLIFATAGLFVPGQSHIWIWLTMPFSVYLVNLLHYLRKRWMQDVIYLLLILYLILFFTV